MKRGYGEEERGPYLGQIKSKILTHVKGRNGGRGEGRPSNGGELTSDLEERFPVTVDRVFTKH